MIEGLWRFKLLANYCSANPGNTEMPVHMGIFCHAVSLSQAGHEFLFSSDAQSVILDCRQLLRQSFFKP